MKVETVSRQALIRLSGLALVCAALLLPLQLDAQAGGAKTALRVGSPFKAGHILVDAAEKFRELIGQASGGRIQVQIQAGSASEEEINDWCSQGKIEMQSNGGRFLEVFAPKYFFFNAPYVMKDFEHFTRVWDGKLGKAAQAQIEQKGKMKTLGIVYRGLRQLTAKKAIFSPAEAAGLKLRLPNVATWLAVWKAMGAAPVPVPLPELYAALKDGRAEASEGDLPQIASFKLNEVQSQLMITNHLVQTGAMLVNKPFFDKLSTANRNAVLKAAAQATVWANEKIKRGELEILVDLQRKGMQVVIPDAESFREKAKPAVEELFKKEWPVATWAAVLAQ